MGVLFDVVREGVSARTAAEFYGLHFGRNGRACCPWHDDRHPDLAFYDEDGARCYCHACHAGGDSIALTAQIFGLSPLDAARKLNADFLLGADETTSAPPVGPTKAELRRQVKQRIDRRFSEVVEVERDARRRLENVRGDWDSSEFRMLVTALALAQDELDWLQSISREEILYE